MKRGIIVILLLYGLSAYAQSIITDKGSANSYPVITASQTAAIFTDADDDSLIQIAASLLQQDIEKVTGKKPAIIHQINSKAKNIIIIGNIRKSALLKQLMAAKKLTDKTAGKWEAYQIQSIQNPVQGIDDALIITGSDRRGTAYGVFELSKQIGVSPWCWWADVPVSKKPELYINRNVFITDAPVVKYRGIFLNDEAPALSGWSKEKFGGFNHLFYEKVFELILRLKANYVWPAMWGNAFYDDDPLNIKSADNYGIVIGTSHHEPLMRAHDEWRRYGKGKWNYDSNAAELRKFWITGMQRATNEKIVSVGMRGDGDEPMSRETATSLLEKIVADQRKIIADVTGKLASQTPQLWALYKEVQDYYDKGMRVPDDITLLLCDDNWGNIRKLPKPDEKPRAGGYGIYYHFDYVGGPRNYKWINTNNIPRIWEQMNLAYEYKATQIWIVNVGDLKPMELPISFFLDQAWKPQQFNAGNLQQYTQQWAAQQFGNTYAKDIGFILDKYTQYNARRKPELLSPETFNYGEWNKVVAESNRLLLDAEKLAIQIPAEYKDPYFELVLHPVKAISNLYQMYEAVSLNKFHASRKNTIANGYAKKVKEFYLKDSLISIEYNAIADGKWNHMMDQTHIGYTYWQQPTYNKIPEVIYIDSITAANDPYIYSYPHKQRMITADIPKNTKGNIFREESGIVSMEAEHYTKVINANGIQWKVIPNIGKTASGITSFPVTASIQNIIANSPQLQYEIYTYDTGIAKLQLYFSPTLPFNNTGLSYAVSIDDGKPQIINLHKDYNERVWNQWVADNIIIQSSTHYISKPGKHIVKYWLIDPAIVLQKLVVDFGGVKPSYLGPPETRMPQH